MSIREDARQIAPGADVAEESSGNEFERLDGPARSATRSRGDPLPNQQASGSRQSTFVAEPARRVSLDRRRSSSPSRTRREPASSVSLLTATLRVMKPSTRSVEAQEEIESGWTPSSTDDDAVRDTEGVRMPRRSSISRSLPPGNISTDSDEVASTIHPRAVPMARSPNLSRSMTGASPDVARRRRRAGTRGQRASSPASYPRSSTSLRARPSGVESEPEDMGTATADDAFLTLLDATREIVTLSTSTSSRAFVAPVAAAVVAPATVLGATARLGPSERSSPGDLSPGDLPSSFMAGSGTSEQTRSSPSSSRKAGQPERPPANGWISWLGASIHLRLWHLIGIAGICLGAGVFCGRSMRALRPQIA